MYACAHSTNYSSVHWVLSFNLSIAETQRKYIIWTHAPVNIIATLQFVSEVQIINYSLKGPQMHNCPAALAAYQVILPSTPQTIKPTGTGVSTDVWSYIMLSCLYFGGGRGVGGGGRSLHTQLAKLAICYCILLVPGQRGHLCHCVSFTMCSSTLEISTDQQYLWEMATWLCTLRNPCYLALVGCILYQLQQLHAINTMSCTSYMYVCYR